ncbi:M1 family metallopeptidase [Planomonospora sp. ID82291]|uniref:M1 family metallopeptidase n=1 Tax=Planomonospora sp. ID82291 TaxID=2738136 RepID=UPI0018C41CB9|nr:M1 family metallopeptidase [Planomonospora sp. ID82291]MBG0817101.1 M1 family metallopeptidase [Planomonospora sp. ID82291]
MDDPPPEDVRPVTSTAHRPCFPTHGDDGFRIGRYDLSLEYKVAANRLGAVARLSATAVRPLERVSLDLGAFRVGGVLVDGRPARFTHRDGRLHLTPGRPEPGPFTVEVRYSGVPRPVSSHWGGVGWEQLTDGVIVAGQPIGAPSWFPCNDRPDDKASYRIAVTTASPYTVVANGELVERRRAGQATTWVYEQAEPMATYLASVQIGRYRRTELGPRMLLFHPARLTTRAANDFGRQDRMMALFTDRFGPYPFRAPYTAVVTEDELEIPVEAQGMSIFGANHVDGARGEERLVAHELAHQWFGNSLTAADWRHIWLHEGFAAYAEWLWSEESGGPSAAAHAAHWHRRLAALPQDLVLADPGARDLFDDRVYKRGALALHALRTGIGDLAFFSLLRTWTAAHRHGSVTTEMFVDLALEYTPRSYETFFASWLYGTRLPPLP